MYKNAKKLDPRSKERILVGYDRRSPAYLVYYPEIGKVERVRCVKFYSGTNPQDEAILRGGEEQSMPPLVLATEKTPSKNGYVTSEGVVGSGERYPTQARNKPAYLSEYVVDSIVDKLGYRSID